jgi:hypothetical protein
MIDDDLRALHRATTATCPSDGRGCPTADELVALSEDRLDGERRAEVLDRVARCATCASGLQVAIESAALARELAAELADPIAGAQGRTVVALPRRRAPRFAAFALAASTILAVGVVALLGRTPAPDPTRGAALAALEPPDRATLDAPPANLRWDCAQPQAVQVQLLDAGGGVRWTGSSSTCDLALPEPARALLGRGLWLWQVQDAGGRTVLAGPYSFRID